MGLISPDSDSPKNGDGPYYPIKYWGGGFNPDTPPDPPPAGYVYLTDEDDNYLIDIDGNHLIALI